MSQETFTLHPIGVVRSSIVSRTGAPRQGYKGAPDAWVELHAQFVEAAAELAVGNDIILITWLHQSRREVLKVHPRGDSANPLTGVFSTRSPDRPNPLGLHRVTILEIVENKLKVGPLEAIDGTPVVDIKPVLPRLADS